MKKILTTLFIMLFSVGAYAQCNNTTTTPTPTAVTTTPQMICEGDPVPSLSATCEGDCLEPCVYDDATCSAVVTVEVCHSYLGDLDNWYLDPPGNGTTDVIQMNAGNPSGGTGGGAGGTCTDVFGDTDNTFSFTFDTENATPFPSSPVSGNTYNLNNETGLNGANINEAGWQIWVFDCVLFDDGNIESVSIQFDCPSCIPSTASYVLNQTATVQDGACGFTATLFDPAAVPVVVPPAATPEQVWYADATGGTPLNGTDAPYTPTDSAPGTYDYFVQCACGPNTPVEDCPSGRTQVDLVIVDVPAVQSAVEDCAGGEGNASITVTADAAPINGAWEYSVDGGTTWQTGGTFTGLADGAYTPMIRNTLEPTCMVSGTAVTIDCPSCNDPCFAEYTPTATGTDGCATAVTAMTACDDGIDCTINDMEVLGADGVTACVPCAGTPVDCSTAGEATVQGCDDGDPCTINDEETILTCDGSVCVPCAGTVVAPPDPQITCPPATLGKCDGTHDCMFSDANAATSPTSVLTVNGSAAAFVDAAGILDPSGMVAGATYTLSITYADPNGCAATSIECSFMISNVKASNAGSY